MHKYYLLNNYSSNKGGFTMEAGTKKIALIGIGNCGNQIAYLGEKKYPELFHTVYINTSEADLNQVAISGECMKYKIGDDEYVEGSGKNRNKAKNYLRGDIKKIVEDQKFNDTIFDMTYVFVIVSAAGGSGSGTGPVMTSILKQSFPDSNIILVGVLPNLKNSSMLELCNAMEFLDEMYTKLGPDQTYMLYDNDSVAGMPVTVGLTTVNDAIIEDIRVFSGVDCYSTPYESIDDGDMETIITTPGRTMVMRITDNLTVKNIEDGNLDNMMIQAIKNSTNAEIDRTKKVVRWGLITYFTEEVNSLYSPSLPKLEAFIGTPTERFNHNAVNNGSDKLNFMHMIAAGLPPINDRISKYKERIEDLKSAMSTNGTGYIMQDDDFVKKTMGELRKDDTNDAAGEDEKVKIEDIFGQFM